MDRPSIIVLSPEVVNQIAAGEVVERPASVVKELVENALDAGARRIDVEVERGGLDRVRVVDDGCGMTPAEARLSLERHATSKLRAVEDLAGIRTMGFRGEALPSIASVSRLTLLTRPAGADTGCRLVVEGGAALPVEPEGCRAGTQIEVRDLFFNTPARLKFLKSTPTEAAHAAEVVSRLGLGVPAVHLTLTQDGRRSLDLPPCRDRLERARAALGRRAERLALATLDEPGIGVVACLGPPEQTSRSAQSVTLLVNQRFVRDRAIVHAVVAGYDELLAAGRFPVAVVHLELDPSALDVNVHPQKVEVRLADPSRVCATVQRCVRQAMIRAAWIEPRRVGRSYPLHTAPAASDSGYDEQKRRLHEATRRFWSAKGAAESAPAYVDDTAAGVFGGLRVVGQLLGAYLVCEAVEERELVLIDHRAARVQLRRAELGRAAAAGDIAPQRLPVPSTLALEPPLDGAARVHEELLRQLGFELEPFGGATWTVRAVPAPVRGADVAALLRGLLAGLAASDAGSARETALERMTEHVTLSCDAIADGEVRQLLAALGALPTDVGDGVIVRITSAELARRLGRS